MPASDLELRYLDFCRKHDVEPNASILLSLSKMKLQKRSFQQSIMEINLDLLGCSDVPPIMDALSTASSSDIDAVDVLQRSAGTKVDEQHLLLLLSAINQKLRVVDLLNWLTWRDVLRYICQVGITCQVLKLSSSPIRKLSLTGKFLQLHTLVLDFSIRLNSFHVNCFTSMPKLLRLSMCETRVANLWTTSAALSKLHSLVELRFQNCLCYCDLGRHHTSDNTTDTWLMERVPSDERNMLSSTQSGYTTNINIRQEDMQHLGADGASTNLYSEDSFHTNHEFLSLFEASSDGSELDFLESVEQTDNWGVMPLAELDRPVISPSHSTGLFSLSTSIQLSEEVMHSSRRLGCDICKANVVEDPESNCFCGHSDQSQLCILSDISNNFSGNELLSGSSTNLPDNRDTLSISDSIPRRYISRHASPICFEKYYREYMMTSLPNLKVLDDLPIRNIEREMAKVAFKKFFECIPYNRQPKDSVLRILQRQELGISQTKINRKHSRESCHSFSRSLSAAKLSSCPRPRLKPIYKLQSSTSEEIKAFRPRQFEYHPVDPRLMVIGTLNGELFVVNHESTQLVGCLPSNGTLNSILGLCWLKKYPSKLIAGSDNGSLHMYDVRKMPLGLAGQQRTMGSPVVHAFADFDQLTSVHINSTDNYFLASGFSRHVSLYDIGSGKLMQTFENLHDEEINVVKFSHHSPTLFATASFDKNVKMWDLRQGVSQPCYTTSSSRGNVMVCFSPDDHYLLASAVDNEVKQLLAVDGRCHMSFNIPSIGSGINYTRSYYMNGRDYIISGSCEEQVVRVCCAQTGRRLKDVSLEDKGASPSMFVQSLRGDPFRDFHMSVLAACWNPLTRSEIVKINLLQSEAGVEKSGFARGTWASTGMGA